MDRIHHPMTPVYALIKNTLTRTTVNRYRLRQAEISRYPEIGAGVKMGADKVLSIPPVAQRDKASFEVMRVWIAEQGQHVSIRSGAWEDPFAWGIVLADLARHIAHAHELQNEGTDTDAFLQRLLEGFQAEIDNPTDEPEGEVTQ
jgi:hypothetical protein